MHAHNVLYRGLTIVVLVTLLLLAASLPGTAAPAAHPAADPNAGWQEVGAGSASGGGISDNNGGSYDPSVAIAPADGTPYVAWRDSSGGNAEIYVRRWNGSSWEEVGAGSATGGGVSDNSGGSFAPSLAIASGGRPYVAWHDYSGGNAEIYVRRWNGSSWEEVGAGSASGGGISDNSGHSWSPSLAIAWDGTPYVAWHDYSGGGDTEIYVRRWNGGSWEEVGAGSASGGGISDNSGNSYDPSVAIAPDGTYVAWSDYSSGDYEIYVRRWNGNSWEEVGAGSASGGGISDNSGNSDSPSAAIAPDGTPYVAWEDRSGGDDDEIYVRRWMEQSGGGEAVYLPIVMRGYCSCGPDNYEPNDWCEQAYGPLTSGQTYPSWISYCDLATYKKSDYFYIVISTTNTINIYLTDIPADTDYDLYLYRNPGDDPDNPADESTKPGSSPETISYNLPATGRYYIRIYSYSGYSTSPYSLRVTYD